MAWTYGIVSSQFPVMSVPLNDDSYHRISYGDQKKVVIDNSTPTVVITREHFYFGNLDAFTDKFTDVRNKFYISHIDGEPQIAELISTMTRWHRQKLKHAQKLNTDVLVLLPSSEIPVSIVTQVMHWVKKSELYEDVILASELL